MRPIVNDMRVKIIEKPGNNPVSESSTVSTGSSKSDSNKCVLFTVSSTSLHFEDVSQPIIFT